MTRSLVGQVFFGLVLCALGFFLGAYWQDAGSSSSASELPCTPNRLPSLFWRMDSHLREFDDIILLAVNVPRGEVVERIRELQTIRRSVEEISVPACLLDLKQMQVAYMDQVIDILVGFVGGVESGLVFQALQETGSLRLALEQELGSLMGATLTPSPTAYQFGYVIPVTGMATPDYALASETPQPIFASISHSEGVNLRQGPGVNYPFFTVLEPGSQVLVLGISPDLGWIFVQTLAPEAETGWVFAPLVSLPLDPEGLPQIATD